MGECNICIHITHAFIDHVCVCVSIHIHTQTHILYYIALDTQNICLDPVLENYLESQWMYRKEILSGPLFIT